MLSLTRVYYKQLLCATRLSNRFARRLLLSSLEFDDESPIILCQFFSERLLHHVDGRTRHSRDELIFVIKVTAVESR